MLSAVFTSYFNSCIIIAIYYYILYITNWLMPFFFVVRSCFVYLCVYSCVEYGICITILRACANMCKEFEGVVEKMAKRSR